MDVFFVIWYSTNKIKIRKRKKKKGKKGLRQLVGSQQYWEVSFPLGINL